MFDHQTCWRLHSIGKTRLLWECKVLEVSYSSGIPVLEGPMETYTSEELEEKLITRARTRQKWHNFDSENFERQWVGVRYEDDPTPEYKWLPGGRWLLLCLYGSVFITDIYAKREGFNHLFDSHDVGDRFLGSNIWIDTTKYWLSEARMAFYRGEGKAFHSAQQYSTKKLLRASSGLIFIFQLNPIGQGMNMTWNMEKMAIKKRPFPGYETELQLEKEYVLALFEESLQRRVKVYLFKYPEHRSHEWVCYRQPEVNAFYHWIIDT
jgi:hypothetical protein